MAGVDDGAFPYSRYLELRGDIERFHKENFPRWPLRIDRDPDGSGYRIQDGASGVGTRVAEDAFHRLMDGMLALRSTTLEEAEPKDLSWAMLQAAQAWIRHRALPNDAMIFCPDPLRYVLIAPGLLEYLEREHPTMLPHGDLPGKAFEPEPYRENGLVLVTADTLWERWSAWDWTLLEYELIRDRELGGDRIRLKQIVPRWNPTDLFLFACDHVESRLPHSFGPLRDDAVLRNAIEVMRRFSRGEASEEEVTAAHAAAQQELDTVTSLPEASDNLHIRRAVDMAQAVLLLTTPDGENDPPGWHARQAVDAAFRAGCRNPAGWIAAKILGRHREAKLLEYLDVGSQEERDAVRNGRLLDGSPRANRTALKMSDLTGVDFTRDEE